MTIRHFRIFTEAVNAGSISKAAEQLRVAPTVVSAAVRELEDHYGVRLFDRVSQRLKITEDGKKLAEYADRMLGLYDKDETSYANSELRGVIRACFSVNMGIYFMPALVKKFNTKYPNAAVQVKVSSIEETEKLLTEGQADLAIVGGNIRSPALRVTDLFVEHLTAVCAPDHRLARHTVTLKEFVELPLLFREKNSGDFAVFREAISQAGYTAQPAWESTSTKALMEAVRYGLGVAVLPGKMAEEEIRSGRLSQITISDFVFRSNVCLAYHRKKYLSPLMRCFIEMAKKGWG